MFTSLNAVYNSVIDICSECFPSADQPCLCFSLTVSLNAHCTFRNSNAALGFELLLSFLVLMRYGDNEIMGLLLFSSKRISGKALGSQQTLEKLGEMSTNKGFSLEGAQMGIACALFALSAPSQQIQKSGSLNELLLFRQRLSFLWLLPQL